MRKFKATLDSFVLNIQFASKSCHSLSKFFSTLFICILIICVSYYRLLQLCSSLYSCTAISFLVTEIILETPTGKRSRSRTYSIKLTEMHIIRGKKKLKIQADISCTENFLITEPI